MVTFGGKIARKPAQYAGLLTNGEREKERERGDRERGGKEARRGRTRVRRERGTEQPRHKSCDFTKRAGTRGR